MASLHLVNGILLTHVFWGGACPRTFFFLFFPFVKEPFEGCKIQKEHMIPFVSCACFHFQALREPKEELKVRSSVLKN